METPRALSLASIFTAAVGLAMVLTVLVGSLGWLREALGAVASDADLERFGFGIAGALLVGWAVSLGSIARPFPKRIDAHLTGLVLWFVFDSAASVASGLSINVVGNVGFLLLLGIPLLGMRRAAPTLADHGVPG